MMDDDVINGAISDFRSMVADPKSVQDDTYMIIVGDARKTASQVRWAVFLASPTVSVTSGKS